MPDPLRILVVNWLDRENPRAGGAETHLHEVFGRLASRGHEVVALVSGWRGCARRTELDGIEVHRSGGRYTFSLTAPPYYRRRLRGRAFDVVVEDLNKVPVFAPAWASAPVLLLVHHLFGGTAFQAGPLPLATGTCLLERPIPLVFRTTPVVAVSESTREDLVRRGLSPERVTVVPNGVDLDRFPVPDGTGRRARPTLAFVARLARYKRVDLIVRAVASLVARGSGVELLVAGEGDQRGALEELSGRLGVQERVRFLGFLPESEKLELLRSAWVHVLTSPKEGWGITNIEAAACGTPSVVSDAPGLRESVRDGRTGLLVPHGDVDALSDALAGLLDDPERREEMGREARRFAEGFSWEATADGVEAALQRVVGAPGPA